LFASSLAYLAICLLPLGTTLMQYRFAHTLHIHMSYITPYLFHSALGTSLHQTTEHVLAIGSRILVALASDSVLAALTSIAAVVAVAAVR
jgi:hypothetical protein